MLKCEKKPSPIALVIVGLTAWICTFICVVCNLGQERELTSATSHQRWSWRRILKIAVPSGTKIHSATTQHKRFFKLNKLITNICSVHICIGHIFPIYNICNKCLPSAGPVSHEWCYNYDTSSTESHIGDLIFVLTDLVIPQIQVENLLFTTHSSGC